MAGISRTEARLFLFVLLVKAPLSVLRAWAAPLLASLGWVSILEWGDSLIRGRCLSWLYLRLSSVRGYVVRYVVLSTTIYVCIVLFFPHGYTIKGVVGGFVYCVLYPIQRYLVTPGLGAELIWVKVLYPTFSWGTFGWPAWAYPNTYEGLMSNGYS